MAHGLDMFTKLGMVTLVFGIVLTLFFAGVEAQQTVYKWVDENGVVHFSDEPPNESQASESETITTSKPPAYVAPPEPATRKPVASTMDTDVQAAQPEAEIPPLVQNVDVTKMSQAELDRRCEDAREKMIAPLREAEIAKCKQTEDTDPARCDRFYADFGNAVRTVHGTTRPRMFNDLPECIEAEQELRTRSR